MFTEAELIYLVRDLGLTEEKVELLGSRLNEKYLLESGTTFCDLRTSDQ